MAGEFDRIVAEVQALVRELEQVNVRVRQAIVFGSHARGDSTDQSDIDVALISDDFEGVRLLDKRKVNPVLIRHDPRLEIHPYKTSEFAQESRWFSQVIRQTGVPVPLE